MVPAFVGADLTGACFDAPGFAGIGAGAADISSVAEYSKLYW